MDFIRILGGDFRTGITFIEGRALKLKSTAGKKESLPFEEIVSILYMDEETRVTAGGAAKGIAAGGILGGVAAGAMAGGLTGPAGAVLGAAAGALLAAHKTFVKRRIELNDGRWFIAEGRKNAWQLLGQLVAEAGREQKLIEKSI